MREDEKWRLVEEKAAKEQAAREKREEEKNWENGKKDQEEAAVSAIRNDTPSKRNTTEIMSPTTNLGGKGDNATGQLTDSWEAGISPERKKSKQSAPVVTPVIESGWYAVAKVSTPTLHPLHNHVHIRVILDAALNLNKDNSITSFTNGLSILINNANMVDEHFAICSVKEGGSEMWWPARDIPNNMISVCSHINILGNNIRMFEIQRSRGGQKRRG
jgi:hypothetical protein